MVLRRITVSSVRYGISGLAMVPPPAEYRPAVHRSVTPSRPRTSCRRGMVVETSGFHTIRGGRLLQHRAYGHVGEVSLPVAASEP